MSTVSSQRFLRTKGRSQAGELVRKFSDAHAPEASLLGLLGEVFDGISPHPVDPIKVAASMSQLIDGLDALRESASDEQWKSMIRMGRSHPLRRLLHEDPFTSRSFHKPRGYAGDAVMMDYIYGRDEDCPRPAASELGSAILDYTTSAPASAGVRERRSYIAGILDDVARSHPRASVLAVAAGHLREAGISQAVRRRRFERFVAMDADGRSLEEVEQRYGKYGIEPVVANVRRMLTGRFDVGHFDLIYSTGLYDYLADSTAKRLTANLFENLKPQGRLVVANFLPGVHDAGYMEMYMDWHLIYRDRGQVLSLADHISQSQVLEIRIISEPTDSVVIMELTRR